MKTILSALFGSLVGAFLAAIPFAAAPQSSYTPLASGKYAIDILSPVINTKQDILTGNTDQLDISGTVVTIKSGALVTNLVGMSGSAATPTFSTDPGTGVFKSATNAIGFATDGTERWVINASGSLVPVGTVDIGNGAANPRDIIATRQFAIGLYNGISVTNDVIVSGNTTNRMIYMGGILITNIPGI